MFASRVLVRRLTGLCNVSVLFSGLSSLLSLELEDTGLYDGIVSPLALRPLVGLLQLHLSHNRFRFLPENLPASLQVHTVLYVVCFVVIVQYKVSAQHFKTVVMLHTCLKQLLFAPP